MKRRILIIDDDAGILQAFRLAFEEEGFNVEAAQSGRPLVERHGECPDVVLLDIMLGEEDGRKLARRVKQNPQWNDTRLILMSAMGDAKESALAAGADYFVAKPVDLDDLIELAGA